MSNLGQTLLLIGLACIIAAIVGGGLKLMGIEIPLLTSVGRQVLLGGMGIALWAGVGIAALVESPSPSGGDGGATPTLPPGTPACYGRELQEIPNDRMASLEEGAHDVDVIRQDQPKDEPVGLMFTEEGRPLGALTFTFYPAGQGLFKIDRVFDAQCREITQFSNATRPGSAKRNLQNHDELRVRFGDHSYTARFGGGATIRLSFNREA